MSTDKINVLRSTGLRYRLVVPVFLAATLAAVPRPAAQYRPEFKITEETLAPLSPAMRSEIAGLHYLLNPFQLRQFFALETDSLRREWIERWWRSQDPTPETAANEMKIEHDRRVKAAREMFRWKGWPGWDHRGEVLIRHGAPQFRNTMESSVSQKGVTPPREYWHYSKLDMSVLFEDFSLAGRYTYAMLSRGNLDRQRTEGGWDWKYQTQQGITSWPIDADFPNMDLPPPPPNRWYIYLSRKQRQRIYNYQNSENKNAATYPFNFDQNTLPFFFVVNQFKGGETVNRVEVSVELPFDPAPPLREDGDTKYTVTAVFFDRDYNELERKSTEFTLSPGVGTTAGSRWLPAQLVFSLPNGYYRAAVIAGEEIEGRKSSYRSVVTTDDFRIDTSISSILFCSNIGPTGGNSPFNRGALETVPRARAEYFVEEAVPVYFELYNLGIDEDGVSRYSVEYWIVPRTLRKWGLWYQRQEAGSYAVSRFDGSAYGSDVPLHVTLDTGHLWPGEFEFHVKVTDTRTLFSAERMAIFHLAERP